MGKDCRLDKHVDTLIARLLVAEISLQNSRSLLKSGDEDFVSTRVFKEDETVQFKVRKHPSEDNNSKGSIRGEQASSDLMGSKDFGDVSIRGDGIECSTRSCDSTSSQFTLRSRRRRPRVVQNNGKSNQDKSQHRLIDYSTRRATIAGPIIRMDEAPTNSAKEKAAVPTCVPEQRRQSSVVECLLTKLRDNGANDVVFDAAVNMSYDIQENVKVPPRRGSVDSVDPLLGKRAMLFTPPNSFRVNQSLDEERLDSILSQQETVSRMEKKLSLKSQWMKELLAAQGDDSSSTEKKASEKDKNSDGMERSRQGNRRLYGRVVSAMKAIRSIRHFDGKKKSIVEQSAQN